MKQETYNRTGSPLANHREVFIGFVGQYVIGDAPPKGFFRLRIYKLQF